MRAVINSVKHIIQITPTTTAAGAVQKITLCEGTGQGDLPANNVVEVRAGAVVKAVYCELWITGDGTESSSSTWIFRVRPPGEGNMTFGEINALQGFVGKNTVLFSGQGLVPPNTQHPMSIFKGWIKIPKGKQRIPLGGQLEIVVSSITNGVTVCGLFIYKEYF